jgi:tetratricopeptide (TPR) repeat protein
MFCYKKCSDMRKNMVVRHITLFAAVMSLFLLTSCESVRYSSTKVQTLNPPARIINLPDTANIAVAAALHSDYLPDNAKFFDSLAMTGIAMAIKNNLEKSPKYNSSYIFPVYTINAGETGLTKENILDIKESSDADYLIAVEEFKTSFHQQRVRTARTNCVRIVTPHRLVVKIYDIDKLTVIDERTIVDTVTFQIDAYAWETEDELIERLPDDKASVAYLIKELSKSYVEEITPFWKEETRFFYIDNNLTKAEYYIDNGDWAKAMEIWQKYVNDANSDLAAISCFNMAVGCEMLGEFELALKWMDNIKRKNANYYWEEYKKTLEKRIAEKAIIDKIMN